MSNVDDQPIVVMGWEGGDLDGTEIGVVVTSAAAMIAAEAFHERTLKGKPIKGKHIAALAEVFVGHVTRWSLCGRDGRPVPIRVEPFLRLHRDMVMVALRRWVAYVYAPPVAEPEETPDVEPAVFDPGLLLEARSLQEPGPDERLVEQVPELVGADA